MTRTAAYAILCMWAASAVGCADQPVPDHVVARVGTATLTHGQLAERLSERMVRMDSAAVARVIVDQWIVNELLYQEAVRRRLHADSLVQQQIEDNRRSLLIARLLEDVYSEEIPAPDPAALETWYQQHSSSLVLREPYVRLWYLPVDSASWTDQILSRLERTDSDSAFVHLVNTYSALREQSMYFASGLLPMSLVFSQHADLRERINRAAEGATVPPYREGGLVHALKVVERAQAGTVPDLNMVLPEIEQRILIESRKQLFARQVQRLRTAAEARNDLFVRE